MIMICGKDLTEIYEQLAIIENAIDNGAVCGVGASLDEVATLLDLIC